MQQTVSSYIVIFWVTFIFNTKDSPLKKNEYE